MPGERRPKKRAGRPAHQPDRFGGAQSADIGQPHQRLDAADAPDRQHEAADLCLGQRPGEWFEGFTDPADRPALPQRQLARRVLERQPEHGALLLLGVDDEPGQL
jgi:hypothetical protein